MKTKTVTVLLECEGDGFAYLKVGDLGGGPYVCICATDYEDIDQGSSQLTFSSDEDVNIFCEAVKKLLKENK